MSGGMRLSALSVDLDSLPHYCRIWGSPDLEADKEVTVTLPRRRPFKKVLHRVERAAA